MKAKKLLAALISVLMVLMLLPSAAFAEGDAPTTLIVGGVEVVKEGQVQTYTSDSTWSYDHDTATLTLNGATINGVSYQKYGAGIYSEDGTLTIKFEGENTVTGATDANYSTAIYAAYSGNLVFSGSGTLEAKGGEATVGNSLGVRASGSVTVSGGTLTATGGKARINSYGVFALNGSVEVSGGTLTATGGEATNSSGVRASGSVTVSGGTLTATGGEATDDSSGVRASGSVTVSGGTLTAEGKTAANSYGVRAYSVSLEGMGVLTAIGGTATEHSSYGISAGSSGSSVKVSGGILSATSGESVSGSSYGVFVGASGTVTISDGVLSAVGKNSMNFNSYGIFILQGDVKIINGIVNATSGVAKGISCGVHAGNGNISVLDAGELLSNKVNLFPVGDGNWLIYGQTGSVQGNVVLTQNITIPADVKITIPDGATLTIPAGVTLTNNGTVESWGTVNGTITGNFIQHPIGVTLNETKLSLVEGVSETLTATVLPENASGKNVTWSSSDTFVATVDENGKVTAVKEGQATITVTTEDGGKTAKCEVTVTAKSYGLKAEPSALDFGSVTEGYTAAPEAKTVTVTNTGNQAVTLTQPTSNYYTIGTLSKSELAPNDTATFTVQPKAGLPVGNYNEVVTVSSTDNTSASVTLDFAVAAKPAPAEYTITFDPNGGYVSYTSATTSGGKLAALPYAYRYGYTFTGWYTVNGIRVSTDMAFTGNTTLYAGWVYNSVVVPEQPVTPVQPVQPEEPEYEWISEDGGTRLYYDGEMITGWYQDEDTGVWYWLDKSSGFMAADQWVKVDGTWYLFGKDGSMLTGWQKVDGKWYYLKPWGGMATGWQLIDSVWYYLRSDGSMAGNAWVQTSGQWYYLTGSGEMATACWIEWKGDWYYLYSSGAMATNATIDGYYVNSNGIWVK